MSSAAPADALIIIPARHASSRFPGKPLQPICGAGGAERPLILRSVEAARQAAPSATIVVATDDPRIAEVVEAAGTAVVMTSPECANGTERVAAAVNRLGSDADVVVNFQGDALLTPPDRVAALIDHMASAPDCAVATVAVRCSASTYRHLTDDQRAGRSGGTTVVRNAAGQALYFSKRVLPYLEPGHPAEADPPVLLHLGLYAYRRPALAAYLATPPSEAERHEGLEQLRFLHASIPVTVLASAAPAWDPVELNNPSDLPVIEAILAERGID